MTANFTALVARLREYADSDDVPISVSACMHSAADAIEAKDRALIEIAVMLENAYGNSSFHARAAKIAHQALGGSDE